jgi:hypothetical protein
MAIQLCFNTATLLNPFGFVGKASHSRAVVPAISKGPTFLDTWNDVSLFSGSGLAALTLARPALRSENITSTILPFNSF